MSRNVFFFFFFILFDFFFLTFVVSVQNDSNFRRNLKLLLASQLLKKEFE